ncbi:MAG: family 20 glycosylhydrolase, partial [Armatimonadetes bacterium]|nr:family 20 glycosylhydrolase [Armatimonadota bacterium]
AAVEAVRKAIEGRGGETVVASSPESAQIVMQAGEVRAPESVPDRRQAHELEAGGGRVVITSPSSIGCMWAAQTFAKLLRAGADGAEMPEVRIIDWPDLVHRGLFCESRWGPDMMTLEDWQHAVDYLLELKFNILTVGIYNCWPIQYYGRVSEWLMVPIRALPQLKSPQRIEYYSPTAARWVTLEYLPTMFEEDFFGELVGYGAARGMTIRPHFNTPGHNTLIPRLIPEVSAKDEDGNPTGYGFCIHNERTYEVMFTIIDEICQRYLLPNGVRSYHIAGDEVYPLRGMNPDRPTARISPWCRCPQCRQYSEGELYVEYIVRIARHLREIGIEDISMWYDQLVRGGQLNETLVRRLEEAGVKQCLILHWWRYWDFFDTTHPEFGFRRWVTPMTGYFYQTSYRGQIDNIYQACRKAGEEKCEGAESYGLFDRSFDRHFRELAEMSWNTGRRTPEDFIQLYARELFGDDWQRGLDALRIFGSLVDSAPAQRLAYSLYRYSHDYAQTEEQATARDNYPAYTVSKLAGLPPWSAEGLLSALSSEAKRAKDIFEEVSWARPEMKPLYIIECERISLMADAFSVCVALIREYERERLLRRPAKFLAEEGGLLQQGARQLGALADRFDELMRAVEVGKDRYLVPHFLRELSLMRRFVVSLKASFETLSEEALQGRFALLPSLELLRITPAKFEE